MSVEGPSDSVRGYVSAESKRRFTILAGILGAAFFMAQILLPILLMVFVMFPRMALQEFKLADLEHSTVWHDDVWFVERAQRINWQEPGAKPTRLFLRHFGLADLVEAKDRMALDWPDKESRPELLVVGDRLWVIGVSTVSYYEGGTLTRLSGPHKPSHASRLFLHDGEPALITYGRSPKLAVLHLRGGQAEWQSEPFSLGLSLEEGSLRRLEAAQMGEGQYLFAEVCAEEGDLCSISYREMAGKDWRSLVTGQCSCLSWTPVWLGHGPAVVLVEGTAKGRARIAVVTATSNGSERQELGDLDWTSWQAMSSRGRLFMVSDGMPFRRKLVEFQNGKTARSITKEGSFPFPFGAGMMAFMVGVQSMPLLLSLALAFALTLQMRKHRAGSYVAQGRERAFASLWQRAWAQVMDAVVLGAGFIGPFVWMGRVFSHPENIIEKGPWFPFEVLGLFALGFLWMLLVLVAFSFLEGRFGKTPGKWLLGIRVVGTDLEPCGFGRALLRNLLTFVDGFFNFLVGVLLVALTENWQRLGDLAARTLVVVDEKRGR